MTADVAENNNKKSLFFFLPNRTGEKYPQGLPKREGPFTPALGAAVFNTGKRMLQETEAMAERLPSSRLEMSLLSRRGRRAGPGTPDPASGCLWQGPGPQDSPVPGREPELCPAC